MNSRERVMAAIAHKKPDRVPMFMDCTTTDVLENVIRAASCTTEEEMLKKLHIDCRWCNCMDDFNAVNTYGTGTFVDMWGVEKSVYGGIPTAHPLAGLENAKQIEEYRHWPDPDQIDYDKYIEKMRSARSMPFLAVCGVLFWNRQRCWWAWKI